MSPSRGRGRPVEVDPDAIALTALRMFADRGVEAVTMAEVAEAAGVSRRTLFRWFPSKAALVWGGSAEADRRFVDAFRSTTRDGDVFSRVRASYLASIVPLGSSADVTRLRLRLIDDHPQVFAEGAERRALMGAHLAESVADALDLAPDDLRVQAIVGAVAGAAYAALVWWARHGGDRSPAEVLGEALDDLEGLFGGDQSAGPNARANARSTRIGSVTDAASTRPATTS